MSLSQTVAELGLIFYSRASSIQERLIIARIRYSSVPCEVYDNHIPKASEILKQMMHHHFRKPQILYLTYLPY